jgi:hypothetical protein
MTSFQYCFALMRLLLLNKTKNYKNEPPLRIPNPSKYLNTSLPTEARVSMPEIQSVCPDKPDPDREKLRLVVTPTR